MMDPQNYYPEIPPDARRQMSDEETVTFRGPAGSMEVTILPDSGADRTTIDPKIAYRIGAGPVKKVSHVDDQRRPVVPVVVEWEDISLPVYASISDRRGPNYESGEQQSQTDAMLGNPLLELFGVFCGWERATDDG